MLNVKLLFMKIQEFVLPIIYILKCLSMACTVCAKQKKLKSLFTTIKLIKKWLFVTIIKNYIT